MENNKPVFYMLVGLPASGKSSESDRLGDELLDPPIILEISSVEI